MKRIKQLVCVMFAVLISLSITACGSNNVYNNENYLTKAGALTASPRFAYYNDGKEVPELEEIDKEIYDEGVVNDGSFTIYFAVSNKSEFDRKITSINVQKLTNKSGYEIVKPSEFTMDSDVYIAAGQTMIIPCIFDKEFVLMNVKLDSLASKVSVKYEGCVLKGAEPEKLSSGFSYSVSSLKFTSTNGVEGSFFIRNNDNTTKKLGKISFELQTNDGKKITKAPVEMNVDTEIEAGDVITLKYAVLPGNVSSKVTKTKIFDSVEIKVTEE